MRRTWCWVWLFLLPTLGLAQPGIDEDRFHSLTAELRCLVCQNQSIADSHAPLAQDLRKQVREMMLAGRSDAEIRDYMTERYGDFVLYRPPMKPLTWALWFGPFLFLLLGLVAAWRLRRPAQAPVATDVSAEDVRRVLDENK